MNPKNVVNSLSKPEPNVNGLKIKDDALNVPENQKHNVASDEASLNIQSYGNELSAYEPS
jgi:hypothetical protein